MKQKMEKIRRRGSRRRYQKPSGDGAAKYIILILAICIAIAGVILLLGRMDSVRGLFRSSSTTDPTGAATQANTTAPVEETTAAPVKKTATLQLMGDTFLNAGIVNTSKTEEGSYDFSPILEPVRQSLKNSFSVCNVVTGVDVHGEDSELSYYPNYNAPQEFAVALKSVGIDLANTASNHAFDFGLAGLLTTRDHLRAAGLDTVGTYADAADASEYYIHEENGIKIGVVSYSYLDGTPEGDGTMKTFDRASLDDVPAILQDVSACREAGADIVVLSIRWGNEYESDPSDLQRQMAKQLCEGGVDILMGHGSHTLQTAETLEVTRDAATVKSYVFYSLGDFMADLTSANRPLTQYGGIARLTLEKEDGKTTISNVGLVPLHLARIVDGSAVSYRVLPAKTYAESASRPAIYKRNSEWQSCKAALQRAVDVMPEEVSLLAE